MLVSHIEQFKLRWLRTVNDFFSIDVFQLNNTQCDQSSVELNGSFLYMQLLLDILLRMVPLSTDKDELIVECMKEYKDLPKSLQDIQDFSEFYEPNTALFWYSRPTFLYQLLNKALRVENIDLLYLYRFFIRDIRDQLAQRQYASPIKVYRGQLMSAEELTRLKSLFFGHPTTTEPIGSQSQAIYICIKSFFSTSLERNVAEFYASGQPIVGTHLVLFEIDADPAVCSHANPFAPLGNSSAIPNEEEVLFALSSTFRLTGFREEDSKSVISLELCSPDDSTLKSVFDNLKKDYGGEIAGNEAEANINSFATTLFNMKKYDLADKFFRRLYNELPRSHRDRARCSHNIGNVALQKGQYKESLRWLNRALDLFQQTWPSDHPLSGNTYHCIGHLYDKKRKYRQAMNAYQVAVNIFKRNCGDDHPRVALCYASMALVYFRKKNFEQAISFNLKALDINVKCLPPFHPDLASIHHFLALSLSKNGQRDLALQHHQKALAVGLKTVPSNDIRLCMMYAYTGDIYRKIGNVEKAADCFREAAVIANSRPLGSRRRPNEKVHYACARCRQFVWTYALFDPVKETYPVCSVFHSKLSFWLSKLCN
jgi:tetratricopeptide (TPR) repeat protein